MQLPDFSQSYNRYSYALNNPLKFTDPDGEFIIEALVILGAYLGGAAVNKNKTTGAWGWNPLKWEPNLKTLGGMVGGAVLGYLGGSAVQGLFASTTTLNLGLGNSLFATGLELNLSGVGPIVKGLGYVTAAGGGLWVTSDFLAGNEPEGPYIDMSLVNQERSFAASGGGPGWEAYAGTAASIGSEMFYSKTYGTWMGKNFKMYQQTFHGNGSVGGMNKFGKTTSNAIKWGGRIVGAYSGYKTIEQRVNGEIGTGWMTAELGTTGISTFGGLYGAAWGVGWELGRAVTNMGWYQEAKFNFWYNRWESQVGPPSQSNETLWYYFYHNYKP